MNFSTKKGFTIIEMILVMVVVSVGVVGVVSVIDYGLNFVERTRKEIIATNLAREGMEAIYNMRDTNWKKRSGKKDKCWLKKDPLIDDGDDGCQNDDWMGTGNYLLSHEDFEGEKYYLLSGDGSKPKLDIAGDNYIDNDDRDYKMCYDLSGFWYNCPDKDWEQKDIREGRFFRMIQGKGLYNKENSNSLTCVDGEDTWGGGNSCGSSTAKEYRFCSVVEYMGNNGVGKVELCGCITNFEE